MSKIRLAHLQLLPLLSGVQNMMLQLLTGLDSSEYEITVISRPGGDLVEKCRSLGFEHIPLPSLRRRLSPLDLVSFVALWRLFRRYRFDIVHTHSSKTGFLGRIAARLAGIRGIVHTVHGFPFHPFQTALVRNFYILSERLAALFCDYLVFVNNYERELAISMKIIKARKAVTILNGLILPELAPGTGQETANLVIGSVSRFSRQKNVIELTRAAVQTCLREPLIIFVLVGDGELLDRCREMVNKAGLQDRIIFPGWCMDVSTWLNRFDLFILYSCWEGLPISILEAMARALPVVASDIKGNNELVSNSNGYLVPINSIDKLTDLLCSLPQSREELKKKGLAGREMVKSKFSYESFLTGYEKIYTALREGKV